MSIKKGQVILIVTAAIIVMILTALKIAGVIDLEWWFLLSPIWAPIAALIPMFMLLMIISKKNKSR